MLQPTAAASCRSDITSGDITGNAVTSIEEMTGISLLASSVVSYLEPSLPTLTDVSTTGVDISVTQEANTRVGVIEGFALIGNMTIPFSRIMAPEGHVIHRIAIELLPVDGRLLNRAVLA